MRRFVHAFIRPECEEIEMRVALNDAMLLYHDAPEAKQVKQAGDHIMQTFMQRGLPAASTATLTLACRLITDTIRAAGKQLSASPRTPAQIHSMPTRWLTCFARTCVRSMATESTGRAQARAVAPFRRYPIA
ncbi:Transcriptional regulatory protein [Mycetohabitans rhizoxinica HKI 454]|uniref:Transcriptional regulatory protein n=2 Tax=Burkholderiaceae TaxID=119060 RepID=E5ANE7_MYCRK|nr:Transcriptional regulatory protein [Mycetohabitans rhizoxinica HKI 454]